MSWLSDISVQTKSGTAQELDLAREENKLLREQVALLRRQLGLETDTAFAVRCGHVFGLTVGQSRVLQVLLQTGMPNREAVFLAYCENRKSPPHRKIIDIHLNRIRKKLAPHAISIETVWGMGYRVSPEAKAKINAMIAGEVAA